VYGFSPSLQVKEFPMTYFLSDGHGRPPLVNALQRWLAGDRMWAFRETDVGVDSAWDCSWAVVGPRVATPIEVAERLVDAPAIRAVLEAGDTPTGRQLELLVAQLALPAVQARLLVDAVQQASKFVLDQKRAKQVRTGVLIGVGLVVVVVVVVAVAKMNRGGQQPQTR
jgi:hypothetical protein